MKITKDLLKKWGACTDGYKWYVNKFPQGAKYSEVNKALRDDKRYNDSGWLTNKVFAAFFEQPELIASVVAAEVQQTLNETKDSPNSSSGDSSKAASSGDYSKAEAKGLQTVAMVAGRNGLARAGEKGAFAPAWLDGEQMRIAVGIVGENGIKADTWYCVNKTGQLVEAKA